MLIIADAKRRIKEISKSDKEYNFLIKLYDDGKLGKIGMTEQNAWDEMNLRAANNLLNSEEIKFDGDAQNYLMDFIEDVKSSIKQQKWARDNNILY